MWRRNFAGRESKRYARTEGAERGYRAAFEEEQENDLEPHGLSEHDDPSLDELRTPVWLRRAFLYLVMSFMFGVGATGALPLAIAVGVPGLAFASGPFSFCATAMAVAAIVAGSMGAAEGGALNTVLGLGALTLAVAQGMVWLVMFCAWLLTTVTFLVVVLMSVLS